MNKELDPVANAVYATANKVHQLVNDLCKTIAYSNITLIIVRLHTLYRCVKIHSQKKIMLYLTLSLNVERTVFKFNIIYYHARMV